MKKMTKAMLMTALICGTMYCDAEPVHANELDTFALDEYVVTATRTPVELFNANANVSVITKEQIEDRHYQDVKEALEEVPGVTVRSYPSPGYANSNSITINGSKKVVLLIDGIRMNQGAEKNLYELITDLGNVERIEVVHGTASSLYGADAQGGVINIITNKKPDNLTKMFIEGGSFDKLHMGLSTQGSENGWSYRIAGTKSKLGDAEDGKGNEIKQSDDAKTFNVMIGKQLGENGDKGDITVFYDKYNSDYQYTSMYSLMHPQYNGKLVGGEYKTESYRMLFNYNFDDTLSNQFSVARNERILLQPEEVGMSDVKIVSLSLNDQLSKKIGDNNTLIIGYDYQEDDFQQGYAGTNGRKLENKGIYIQDIHKFNEKVNLSLGGRFDDSNLYEGDTTYSAKVGYNFNDNTNMYVSYGTFFNLPDTYALFSKEHGNSGLNPEQGKNIELGFNHKFDDTSVLSAHVFKRDTDEKIRTTWYKDASGNYSSTYENADSTEKAKGFDIQYKKYFSEKWDMNFAYTYTKKEVSGDINDSGFIPKHIIDLGVNYKLNKLKTSVIVKGILDRPGLGETAYGNFFPAEDYWLVDLALNYKADKNHKFYFKVNNLLDKYYAEESAASPGWGGDGPEDWWAMPGRSFIVGMEYSF